MSASKDLGVTTGQHVLEVCIRSGGRDRFLMGPRRAVVAQKVCGGVKGQLNADGKPTEVAEIVRGELTGAPESDLIAALCVL